MATWLFLVLEESIGVWEVQKGQDDFSLENQEKTSWKTWYVAWSEDDYGLGGIRKKGNFKKKQQERESGESILEVLKLLCLQQWPRKACQNVDSWALAEILIQMLWEMI